MREKKREITDKQIVELFIMNKELIPKRSTAWLLSMTADQLDIDCMGVADALVKEGKNEK